MSLQVIFSDCIKRNLIPKYDRAEFIPYSLKNPADQYTFNTFQGFPIKNHKAHKKYDFVESRWFKHIKEQMCADDEASFNFTLAWIAHLCQRPEEVAGTALLFFSHQGNGKDLFGRFISLIVGSNCSGIYDNTDAFFSNFNSDMNGLLFAVLNEVADKGEAYKKHNQLKSFITREEAKIEPKGKDKFQRSVYARYALFTNNPNPVFIENTDRRFAMFRCLNDYAQNEKYFSEIIKEISDPDYIKCAFDYFINYDISEFNIRSPPETAYKLEQKIANLSNSLRFVKHLFDDEVEFSNEDIGVNVRPKKGDVVITKEEFYKRYRSYCESKGENSVIEKSFMTNIKEVGLEMKLIKANNQTFRGIVLHRDTIRDEFRKHLRNKHFQFGYNEIVEDEVEESEDDEQDD